MAPRRHLLPKQSTTELRTDRNAVALSFADDRRYRLIARLEAAAAGRPPDKLTEWPGEISVSASQSIDVLSFGRAAPPLRRDVRVTFDHRMPLRSVCAALQRAWPVLRKQGIVRATRPLGARTLALIEHVCIEASRSSWAERHKAWNMRHARWRVSTRQAFISEFRVAERSLTGAKYGLAYWYEPNARLTARELHARARNRNVSAKRELDRRAEAFTRAFEGVGFQVDPKLKARAKGRKR